eukprot:m.226977 g.226977  ORF g.226977 m.226977 type:complete len:314 (-) comp11512_c0_seq1:1188-2129(-)
MPALESSVHRPSGNLGARTSTVFGTSSLLQDTPCSMLVQLTSLMRRQQKSSRPTPRSSAAAPSRARAALISPCTRRQQTRSASLTRTFHLKFSLRASDSLNQIYRESVHPPCLARRPPQQHGSPFLLPAGRWATWAPFSQSAHLTVQAQPVLHICTALSALHDLPELYSLIKLLLHDGERIDHAAVGGDQELVVQLALLDADVGVANVGRVCASGPRLVTMGIVVALAVAGSAVHDVYRRGRHEVVLGSGVAIGNRVRALVAVHVRSDDHVDVVSDQRGLGLAAQERGERHAILVLSTAGCAVEGPMPRCDGE